VVHCCLGTEAKPLVVETWFGLKKKPAAELFIYNKASSWVTAAVAVAGGGGAVRATNLEL
jgi:hypothetical protein